MPVCQVSPTVLYEHFVVFVFVDSSIDDQDADTEPGPRSKKFKQSAVETMIGYLDKRRQDDNTFREKQLALEEKKLEAGNQERQGMLAMMGKMMDRMDNLERK